MRLRHLILVTAPFACAAPAFAQDVQAPPPEDTSVTIGAAGILMPDYEGSKDYHLTAAPGAIGSIEGFNFTLAGNRLSVDLVPSPPGPSWDIQAGPIAVANINRSSLKGISDPRVRALGKRPIAAELGGFVGIGKTGVITSEYDQLSVSISYRKGVSGAHRGAILSPTINYFTPVSRKAGFGLFVTAEHVDRKYAAAYFDVDAAGSLASGLPVFSTRGGWKNYMIGGLGTVALTGDLLHGFKLVGGVTYEKLLNDFEASPLVSIAGRPSQWMGVLGVAYTF